MRVVPAGLCLLVLAACAPQAPRFSGTVQTEYVTVGSEVGGRVVETGVAAGQRVHRGTVIVRLDASMPQAAYNQAVAQERAAAAALHALQSGTLPSQVATARGASLASGATYVQTIGGAHERIVAAREALANARAQASLARHDYVRAQSLAATGDIARQSLDQARAAHDQADATVRQLAAQLARLQRADIPGESAAARANAIAARRNLQAVLTGSAAQIAQARAQLRSAQAAAAHARAELREATVTSTVDGVVSSFNLHPGDLLAPNQAAAIIDTFADPYVYIYASQNDLETIRGAKSLLVRSDAGAGTFTGTVEAYDRQAQFTPQNVETADQRAELVYGVKIRIHDPDHKLLDGTTVTVEVR